ncbi:hypothetical protein [Georgenia sp. SYP-B2076]|uniref:hypothetical protein n=1 Tax=Georgenia sp. SYP-B2076 TaxID=2495881 RepID=UPI000F8E811A|nr:hypothetical protein [Georgenia sp. SYP-B2076]
MPSYRVRMAVGLLRPGVAPEGLLPAAADAAAEVVTVEARDVAIVRGAPVISVRFTADDDGDADAVARRVEATVRGLATPGRPNLECRAGGRWRPVR